MTTVIEAVYEDGVLKPLAPPDLKTDVLQSPKLLYLIAPNDLFPAN